MTVARGSLTPIVGTQTELLAPGILFGPNLAIADSGGKNQ